MPQPDHQTRAAVFDMGKSNVKLSAVTLDGAVLETLSTPNTVLYGPPWRHNDLAGLGDWLLAELAAMCRRHAIGHVVATGYGSGGVLTGDDPLARDGGAALPMIDYEQALPAEIAAAYPALAGSFFDRGSAIMPNATHQARQLLWMARAEPARFAAARHFLNLPQYWAWRLSGIAVSEASTMGAQSQLWNVAEQRFAPIVETLGWRRLMPPFAHAGTMLGPLLPELAKRFGLPPHLAIHTGAHDSSTNFYRYQAAGMSDLCVASTGTWIAALADRVPVAALDEPRNMTLNSDLDGRPTGGALAMGGREFASVAGDQPQGAAARADVVSRLIARGTFALPSFGADSGQFPGSGHKGRIEGPPPADAAERQSLAVLHVALLTAACAGTLAAGRSVVLDGSYLKDPLYAPLVAGIRGPAPTRFNTASYGIAAGAALLCRADRSVPVPLDLSDALGGNAMPGLAAYARRWHELAEQQSG